MKKVDLFIPLVETEKMSPFFQWMLRPPAEPARLMMNEIFLDFPDTDGNFIEQFQTTGYDARIFELYLFAYLADEDFDIKRDHTSPDFIVTRGGVEVAIEVTTSNPQPGYQKKHDSIEKLLKMSREEIRFKGNEEIPIRLGSALFSKLQKKYWEMDQCIGLPFVIAIEAFHEENAYIYDDLAFGQYLFGLRQYPYETKTGKIDYLVKEVSEHKVGNKVIPSNFFHQKNAENISAVIFSNSGTYSKFVRIGYQKGYHRGNLEIIRFGTQYIPYKDTTTIKPFYYDMENPMIFETWGQGLVVFHNPQAKIPLPRKYFIGAMDIYLEDGKLFMDIPEFHPQGSITYNLIVAEVPEIYSDTHITSILKFEFDQLGVDKKPQAEFLFQEKQWFKAIDGRIVGVVIQDKFDNDWNWIVFGRDSKNNYKNLDMGATFLDSRQEAVDKIVTRMEEIYVTGQEVFDSE